MNSEKDKKEKKHAHNKVHMFMLANRYARHMHFRSAQLRKIKIAKMKKLLIILISLITFNSMSGQNKMHIAFSAKESGVGHAFVTLGREDPELLMTVHEGTWGLYPKKSNEGGKSFFIGEVPGEIRDDFLTQNDFTFVVTVNEDEYQKALAIVEVWRNKNYELLKNDCLSFLIEIATTLNGKIKIPERSGFDNHPAEYLKELINKNQ